MIGELERARAWRQLPRRAGLALEDVEALRSVGKQVQFRAGSLMYSEGDPGIGCYLLVSGRVIVSKRLDDRDTTLATLASGAFVGQMSLVSNAHRAATVTVQEDVLALLIDRTVFLQMLRSLSPLALRLRRRIVVAAIRQLRLGTTLVGDMMLRIDAEQRAEGEARKQAMRMRRRSSARIRVALHELDVEMNEELDGVRVANPPGQLQRNTKREW